MLLAKKLVYVTIDIERLRAVANTLLSSLQVGAVQRVTSSYAYRSSYHHDRYGQLIPSIGKT
jgi:hypothetical protein